MKEFIKKYYSILIPAFLVIVILIAVILYAMEYKNNRYAIVTNTKVYQYFSGNKMEYTAKVGRNRKHTLKSVAIHVVVKLYVMVVVIVKIVKGSK